MTKWHEERRSDDGRFGALTPLLHAPADRRAGLHAAAVGLAGILAALGSGDGGIQAKKKKGKKKLKGGNERCRRTLETCASNQVCCSGLFCLPSDPEPDRCCLQETQPCQADAPNECCHGNCVNGQCACRAFTALCEQDFQCCSGNCHSTGGIQFCDN
jgi:hypothetical protein